MTSWIVPLVVVVVFGGLVEGVVVIDRTGTVALANEAAKPLLTDDNGLPEPLRPLVERALDDVDVQATDVVVSSHACGRLTDLVLDRAVAARARVAVLPCCHDLDACDAGELTGWVGGPVAIDIMRVVKLEQNGYHIRTQTIPSSITPKNRSLLATT